ncbi:MULTISPECIES: MFS transporter [unclassified Enterococcus]|uniref:MFS transporter n=1 Tax=unclassified Enterococcus TaxID=2608891 RepID=UPI0015554811|nr:MULTISPECIES: MFS transporter [unclassified Enterococcus]MBS7576445.1 MFS transporter [Enterococcus sp. MMGLQ5-2]MBS7583677.1 MFS transporter [Enterococcus sp. MMGLQ5-1]NPD11538.1 MFS transporter [Enterococcus sp. MMGLQ5-1]NPD36282.1 MFS transporter [Enterococcus sp. MMGLQ5-2]
MINEGQEIVECTSLQTEKNEVKIFSKDLLLVMLVGFLAGTAITTQMGTLPLYIDYLGGSKGQSGMVVGILGISSLFCRIPVGRLLDRYGRKLILCMGLIILVIDFMFLNLFHEIMLLFILRFIQGLGMGIESTATSTLASDLIPKSRLTVGLGYFSIALTLPSAIGPLIGLFLVQNYGFNALFFAGLLLTILAAIASLFISDQYKKQLKSTSEKVSAAKNFQSKSLLLKIEVIIPSLIMFLVCLTNSAVTAFISQFAIEKSVNNIGYYFTVNAITTVVVRIIYPRIFRNIKNGILVSGSIIVMIASFWLISVSQTLFHFLLAAILFGIGFASILPIMNAIVLNNVSKFQRGNATAIFSAAMDVAYGGGAMIWGFIAMLSGFSLMYQLCGALVALTLLIAFKFKKFLF